MLNYSCKVIIKDVMYPCCHLCAVLGLARTACWASCAPAESGCKSVSSSEAHPSFRYRRLLDSSLLPPLAVLLLYSVIRGQETVKRKHEADSDGVRQ